MRTREYESVLSMTIRVHERRPKPRRVVAIDAAPPRSGVAGAVASPVRIAMAVRALHPWTQDDSGFAESCSAARRIGNPLTVQRVTGCAGRVRVRPAQGQTRLRVVGQPKRRGTKRIQRMTCRARVLARRRHELRAVRIAVAVTALAARRTHRDTRESQPTRGVWFARARMAAPAGHAPMRAEKRVARRRVIIHRERRAFEALNVVT